MEMNEVTASMAAGKETRVGVAILPVYSKLGDVVRFEEQRRTLKEPKQFQQESIKLMVECYIQYM